MQHYRSVSEVARRLGVNPRDISDPFYRRELRDDLCPIVAGRRLIPESYIPEIEAVLRREDGRRRAAVQGAENAASPRRESRSADIVTETVAKEDFSEFVRACLEKNLRVVRTDDIGNGNLLVQTVPEGVDS